MTIRQSKTNQLGQSPTLFLLETGGLACPVSSVIRQFLIYFDGNPLTRYQFSSLLAKTSQFLKYKQWAL